MFGRICGFVRNMPIVRSPEQEPLICAEDWTNARNTGTPSKPIGSEGETQIKRVCYSDFSPSEIRELKARYSTSNTERGTAWGYDPGSQSQGPGGTGFPYL